MANTYFNIAGYTLTSNTTTISFSSIPATYDHLVLRMHTRTSNTSTQGTGVWLRYNGTSGTSYSDVYLFGRANTATLSGGREAGYSLQYITNWGNDAGQTSGYFSPMEVYVSDYCKSGVAKPGVSFAGNDSFSSTVGNQSLYETLFDTTTAISSIAINNDSGGDFIAGSTFYLYGIKNS